MDSVFDPMPGRPVSPPSASRPEPTTGPFGEPIVLYRLQCAIKALPASQGRDHVTAGGFSLVLSGDPAFLRVFTPRGRMLTHFSHGKGKEALEYMTEHYDDLLSRFEAISKDRVAHGIEPRRAGIDYGFNWP